MSRIKLLAPITKRVPVKPAALSSKLTRDETEYQHPTAMKQTVLDRRAIAC